jgi:hypothetical protein
MAETLSLFARPQAIATTPNSITRDSAAAAIVIKMQDLQLGRQKDTSTRSGPSEERQPTINDSHAHTKTARGYKSHSEDNRILYGIIPSVCLFLY